MFYPEHWLFVRTTVQSLKQTHEEIKLRCAPGQVASFITRAIRKGAKHGEQHASVSLKGRCGPSWHLHSFVRPFPTTFLHYLELIAHNIVIVPEPHIFH